MIPSKARKALAVCVVVSLAALAFAANASAAESVWGWGVNTHGELGNGTTATSKTPVASLYGATAIAGGTFHSLAVFSGGHVAAWGSNQFGELGNGTRAGPQLCGGFACSTTPVAVSGLSNVAAVAGGVNFSLALLSNGTVMAWGLNTLGQLGDGTFTGPSKCKGFACSTTPVAVSGLTNVIAIAAGGSHALALLSNHTVMAWGANDAGQLGQLTSSGPQTCASSIPCSTTPVLVKSASGNALMKVDAIAAGDAFSLAMFTNVTHEQIDAWGLNAFGQLGDGSTTGPNTCFDSEPCGLAPTVVSGLTEVKAIAASGDAHQALAILSDGSVAAWGDNELDQVGNGCSTNFCPNAMLEGGVSGARAIATSFGRNTGRSMALLSTGQVVDWGFAPLGVASPSLSTCIGISVVGCDPNPVTVTGLAAPTAIAEGGEQSLALALPPGSRFNVGLTKCFCTALTLKVNVPAPGLLVAGPVIHHGPLATGSRKKSKPLLKPAKAIASSAGTVTLKLKLTKAGGRALKRKHKLKIKVLLTFTPTGGVPSTQTITVTFRKH